MVRQGQKGAAEATFFENEAINLLTAIIMFVVEITGHPGHALPPHPVRGPAHLHACRCWAHARSGKPNVREYIEDVFIGDGDQIHAWSRCAGRAACSGATSPKLLGSFLSEINSNLAFWDGHPGFAEVTATSDFRFADLERETVTVYLTIPFKDMPTSYRFLRAMIGLAFAALEEKQDAKRGLGAVHPRRVRGA